jgi:hypothetical protein
MHGTDDCRLLDRTYLASDRPTRGSSAFNVDPRAIGFQQPKLYITISLSLILKSVRAALVDHHWRVAMDEEYTALMTNGTWDLVSRPRGGNVVTDKWMFKHKFKANETLEGSS